ncbi:hypothetical protein Trihar35433_5852 [Trichoderma harzianum]|nr:hypothetical protein Trihar35433_5852 [Trichoderma harzianum]
MSSVQPDISKIFVNYLRNSRQLSCPICQVDVKPPTLDGFKQHVQNSAEKHPTEEKAILDAFQRMKLSSSKPPPQPTSATEQDQNRRSKKRSAIDQQDDQQDPERSPLNAKESSDNEGRNKKICSPSSSPPPSTPNRRGRGRQQADNIKEFDRGTKGSSTRQLWSPGSGGLPRSSQFKAQPPGNRSRLISRAKIAQHDVEEPDPEPGPEVEAEADDYTEDPSVSQLIRQPETRPISQEQLVAEVKGIYAGLVMVESKCIEVDNAQSANKDSPQQLNNEQWQALIALHRTLLHEHHDFFLASQHPSASPALRRLASKLPLSLEHMLTFIYIAYSMMALLYETVPAFEDTWIECLGDLGRYRMAIEDDDIRDRETWTAVSRYWYSKASDKLPTTGRLYHHLAILARPNALQQTYYYTKSLCVPIPFLSARESVMTLFDPVLSSGPPRLEAIDLAFVRILAIFFSGKEKDLLGFSARQFLSLLDGHIARITKSWLEAGYYMGISITCSLLGFGEDSNVLKHAIMPKRSDDMDIPGETTSPEPIPTDTFYQSLSLAVQTLEIQSCKFEPRMDSAVFPGAENQDHYRPLPEDYAMRGLIYTEEYFPLKWFSGEVVEEDEKYFEQASMVDARKERILWIGRQIASVGKWLLWDENARFTVPDEYDIEFTAKTPEVGAREITA